MPDSAAKASGKTGAAEQATLFGEVAPVDDKIGHRGRLRERFRQGGADALPDYELLEMVLFRVFSRGDPSRLPSACSPNSARLPMLSMPRPNG